MWLVIVWRWFYDCLGLRSKEHCSYESADHCSTTHSFPPGRYQTQSWSIHGDPKKTELNNNLENKCPYFPQEIPRNILWNSGTKTKDAKTTYRQLTSLWFKTKLQTTWSPKLKSFSQSSSFSCSGLGWAAKARWKALSPAALKALLGSNSKNCLEVRFGHLKSCKTTTHSWFLCLIAFGDFRALFVP